MRWALLARKFIDWPLDELVNPTLGHNLVGKQLKLKWKKEDGKLLELGEIGGVDHWLGAECIAFNAITGVTESNTQMLTKRTFTCCKRIEIGL